MAKSISEQIADLKQAIAVQESVRGTLGDTVVDITLATLHEKLTDLEHQLSSAGQQRKQATVLLADVSSFTAMSETLDAEEVTDLMNDLWAQLDAVVRAHGGQINKHIGDAVMALWGAEEAREDAPEQAIRAALAMQAALAAFRERRNVTLAMRVGINTGPVLLGQVGTASEFSVMGDTVNLASRLEHTAPVGGIRISHATYRHVRGVFDITTQELIRVKGKDEPVQTYVVARAKPRAFRVPTRGVLGIETRMIGRDAELRRLQDALHHAMDHAETHFVMIVGDAGVGKSRLLYEFDNWIELLPEDVFYFKGRARQETARTPFALFHSLFAVRFDIRETDSAAAALAKFRAEMAGFLDADHADLVGHLMGFDFSGSPAVAHLLQSPSFGRLATAYLTNYLRALAADSPTVIFLEDLHWADDSSLNLIEHLTGEIPAGRLLVVGLARPEFFERHPDWGPNMIRLDLQPLAKNDSQELVNEILQKAENVPVELSVLVVTGAEGNPLYVEELIHMLIEDGVIVRGDDVWRIEIDRLQDIRVSPTLTGVLQARLDSLPPGEKAVLQRASVVGRRFWDAIISALDEQNALHVQTALNAARDRELILQHDRSAFEGAREYVFKHTLLRNVTYETVPPKLRRAYHAQVAHWLEDHAGDRIGEYLSLIAGHYELADEQENAADYWRRAGSEQLKVSSYREAVDTLQHALDLLPEDAQARRAIVLIEAGRAYNKLSDYPTARQCLEQGLALAREAGDRTAEVDAYNELFSVADNQSAADELQMLAESALTLARASGYRKGLGAGLNNLANLASKQGHVAAAQRYYQEAMAIAAEVSNRRGEASCLHSLAVLAGDLGNSEESRQLLEASLAIRKEIGDEYGRAVCLMNLGVLVYNLGNYDQARQHFEASLAIHRDMGDKQGMAYCLNNMSVLAIGLEMYDAARQYCEESLAIQQAIGSPYGVALSLHNLGVIASNQKAYARARELYAESLAIRREIKDRRGIAVTLNELGAVARKQGELDQAHQHHQEALTLFQEIGDHHGLAHSITLTGYLKVEQGDPVAARDLFIEALTQASAIEDIPITLMALAGLAWLQAKGPQPARAAEWVGLALRHAATHADVKVTAELAIPVLRERLSAADLDAALERGKTLDLDAVVAEILADSGT
jgi:predicted ATPase/class 3 adenylate cyclase